MVFNKYLLKERLNNLLIEWMEILNFLNLVIGDRVNISYIFLFERIKSVFE